MAQDRGARIRAIRVARKESQVKFGSYLGVTQASISRWETGNNWPSDDELAKIVLLGREIKEFRHLTIAELRFGSRYRAGRPVVTIDGRVASGEVVLFDEESPLGQGLEHVEDTLGLEHLDIFALRVRGDFFLPTLEDGWLILYRRLEEPGVPEVCIGEVCIVKLRDGSCLIKKLYPGSKPGLYHLHSWHARMPILHDQDVEWAWPTIGFRKP